MTMASPRGGGKFCEWCWGSHEWESGESGRYVGICYLYIVVLTRKFSKITSKSMVGFNLNDSFK